MGATVRIGEVDVSARWLRDHGDDAGSVEPRTGQRVVDTFAIPRDVEAVSVTQTDTTLRVEWSDGATTTHDLGALLPVIARPRSAVPSTGRELSIDPAQRLWRSPTPPEPLPADVIDDDEGWAAALSCLHLDGWVQLDGVALGRDAVERLARRLGYARSTIFGDIWTMAAGAQDHADSAYDPTALEVHTDGTYSHDAPGVIVFCQQRREGTGGDSVLVDGFAAAADFAAADPDAADLLTRFAVAGRYVEPGVDLRAERPPFGVDPEGLLRQVTFNNYDRAPVLPAAGIVDDVIDAYAAFHDVITDPGRALHLTWTPGRVLIFDNWRLLHGRTAYTGAREFMGFYSNHEDLESAWRLAGMPGRSAAVSGRAPPA